MIERTRPRATRHKITSIDPPRKPRRRRRWLLGGLLVLVVLVGLRVAAPWIVAAQIESRLGEALGATVRVDDVDLRLWAGELRVHGLHAAPADSASASALSIRTLQVSWRWRELLRGSAPLDLQMDGVAVTLDLHAPWPAEPAARTSQGLGPLRSLALRDGRLEVVLAPDAAPVLALDDIRGVLHEGAWGARGEAMTTQLRVAAGTGEGGRLALTGAFSPARPREIWTLQFALDRLDLRPQNPLFREVLEMDLERGTLSVTGDLTSSGGRLRGHVVPSFDQLTLLDAQEPVRHPMAEALFSSMLATSDLPIEIDRAASLPGGGLAVRLDNAFRREAMDLLRQLILRGFTRRLNTLIGHDATIGGLDVDFPRGALVFTDVTLRKTDGVAELPFLHVARLEVIVEPSAVDPSIETFKAVVLHEPHLVYIVGRTEAASQRSIDPDWQTKVSALPYPTDRLEIVNGRLEYRDETTSPPSRFVLSGLGLAAENLARARREPGTRGATLTARALVTSESSLSVEAAFSPGSEALDGELRLTLAPVQLTRLNGLLRSNFGVDVSSGTLGLVAEFDARAGHLTGAVTPALSDVTVLGMKEQDITHPLRELLIELRLKRLDGVRLPLDIHAQQDLLRKIPRALLAAIRDAPGGLLNRRRPSR